MTKFNKFRSLLLGLVMLLSCNFVHATSIEQPGVLLRIVSTVTGKALSNGNNAEHDTFLQMDDLDKSAQGQDWVLVRVDAEEPDLYAFYNPNYGMGIDMAPGKDYHLLQWEGDPTNANQQFLIQEVEGLEGVYQILSSGSDRVLTVREDGTIYMDQNKKDKNTYFRFESTDKVTTSLIPHQTYVFKTRAMVKYSVIREAMKKQPFFTPSLTLVVRLVSFGNIAALVIKTVGKTRVLKFFTTRF